MCCLLFDSSANYFLNYSLNIKNVKYANHKVTFSPTNSPNYKDIWIVNFHIKKIKPAHFHI